jgi:pilus assembly protein FimV
VATAPVTKPKRVIDQQPELLPEPSIVESLLTPVPLGGLGALLALLVGYVIYKRRKKPALGFEGSSMLGDSSMQANSMFGSTGGQSVDTNNSVFNSNFAPSASQLDTNEVDPVAEADVYIAYGRDVQAEEILKEALRTQPERNAVRLKLLEIYANRKDTRAFEVQASELYGITQGDGDDWAQAASLGISIDPNNPLYAGAETDDLIPSPVMHAATEPIDDLDPEAILVSTQQPAVKPESLNDLDLDLSPAMAEDEFDFNLDDLPAAPVVTAAPAVAAPVAAAVEEDDQSLDFDLGGLTFEPTTPKAEVKLANPAPTEPASTPEFSMDEQSFDLPSFTTAPEVPAAASIAASAESEFDLGTMDFGLPEAGSPSIAAAEPDMSADDFFSVPKLDLGDEETFAPSKEPTPAAAQAFDLSGIDLDLGDQEEPIAQIDQNKMDAFAIGDDPSGDQVEMDTKLDLAIAYQEIGDKEGARELIDEVIKGGTPEQMEKAKAMRVKLA